MRNLVATLVGLACVIALHVADDATVWADSATGWIEGVVKDHTGQPAAGATVVATSPSLQGEQVQITDEQGRFVIRDLPVGEYRIAFYYSDLTVERSGVKVVANKAATVSQMIDTSKARQGELIVISGTAPIIDSGSTRQGITIDRNYIKNIPTPGRTFSSVLGAAPGASPPVSFSGATSIQNNDVVHNTEAYSKIDDNLFRRVSTDPLSTFSIDVDTASYTNMRRFINDGALPPQDAVRVEELLNYFHYNYPAPAGSDPVSITTEVGPSPWHPSMKLVRIGLASKPIASDKVPARNLVFLLDISGSMQDENKLPLVLSAMELLTQSLRSQDRVAIVVYASGTGVLLPSTPGNRKDLIRSALGGLTADGSTNGAAGIQLAYQQARDNFIKGGINRVILCTDGDFNVGTTSEGELVRLIEGEREHGVFLTVLGFGMGNLKDATMEKLADKGNGNYAYIDGLDEARRVLVSEAGATLVTVAKDVKIQVEFNPLAVAGYRLVGYENRLLANEDFNDDKKDAGELGAGHAVTALYELVPFGAEVPASNVDKLKYQTPTRPSGEASNELLTVKVRYKPPAGDTSLLLSRAVTDASPRIDQTSTDFRWAVAVASFGMLLRKSPQRGSVSWPQVFDFAKSAVGTDREGYRREFLKLVDAANKLERR